MADTSIKEKIAELQIASELGRRGLLIAKPYFDDHGADLLGFRHVCGGAKFCRIQSKYRQEGGSIEVAWHYARGAFVCILYVVSAEKSDGDAPPFSLYCFFPAEIANWRLVDGKHVLSIPSHEKCKEKFAANAFNGVTFQRLIRLIDESKPEDEMGALDFSNPNNSGLIAVLGS